MEALVVAGCSAWLALAVMETFGPDHWLAGMITAAVVTRAVTVHGSRAVIDHRRAVAEAQDAWRRKHRGMY